VRLGLVVQAYLAVRLSINCMKFTITVEKVSSKSQKDKTAIHMVIDADTASTALQVAASRDRELERAARFIGNPT
jgi:hypothetical protein